MVLLRADRAELDAGIPQRVGPRPQQFLQLLGAGVGGEVQIGDRPLQHRVAHRAADQIQLVAGGSEQPAEVPRRTSACLFSATAAAVSSSASGASSGTGQSVVGRRCGARRPLRSPTIRAVPDDDAALCDRTVARSCSSLPASVAGASEHASYYRLGVRRRKIATASAPGEAPRSALGRVGRGPIRQRGGRRRHTSRSSEARATPLGTPRTRAAAHGARDVGGRTGHRQHRSTP